MGSGGAHGCGQCLPCRLKKRREWTHRIMLEAGLYADNAFLTLTYAEDPVSLEPADLRAFMKALRKRIEPMRVRFYGVGEYGDLYGRPHFHVALFGYPTCLRPGRRRGECECKACAPIRRAWVDSKSRQRGFVMNLPLEMGSARYIARYVVKKMTRTDDPRLGNRHPEFARMSLKPGIGAGVLDTVAKTITRYKLLTAQGDVPVTLRHGDIEWPLGRYLRGQLRIRLGLDKRAPHVQTAQAAYEFFQSEENAAMRALQKAALDDAENPSLKAHLLKATAAARAQVHRRINIFETKGTL